MKNRELIELSGVLEELSTIKNKNFAYAIFKNKMLVEKELEIFNKIKFEVHPDQTKYEEVRNALCETHAKKDESGTAIIKNDQYIIEDMEAFKTSFADEVFPVYQEVISHIESENKKYEEFLEEENAIVLMKVAFADLPDEIDANYFGILQHMID